MGADHDREAESVAGEGAHADVAESVHRADLREQRATSVVLELAEGRPVIGRQEQVRREVAGVVQNGLGRVPDEPEPVSHHGGVGKRLLGNDAGLQGGLDDRLGLLGVDAGHVVEQDAEHLWLRPVHGLLGHLDVAAVHALGHLVVGDDERALVEGDVLTVGCTDGRVRGDGRTDEHLSTGGHGAGANGVDDRTTTHEAVVDRGDNRRRKDTVEVAGHHVGGGGTDSLLELGPCGAALQELRQVLGSRRKGELLLGGGPNGGGLNHSGGCGLDHLRGGVLAHCFSFGLGSGGFVCHLSGGGDFCDDCALERRDGDEGQFDQSGGGHNHDLALVVPFLGDGTNRHGVVGASLDQCDSVAGGGGVSERGLKLQSVGAVRDGDGAAQLGEVVVFDEFGGALVHVERALLKRHDGAVGDTGRDGRPRDSDTRDAGRAGLVASLSNDEVGVSVKLQHRCS